MAEADELCERIAIVDHGRILAIGSPGELKRRVQRESIFRLELDRLDGGPSALSLVPGVVSAVPAADAADAAERQTVVVNLVLEQDAALGGVVEALAGLGSRIVAVQKSEPSLEDVFVELVGRGFEDAGEEPSDHKRNGSGGAEAEALAATTADVELEHEPGDREHAEVA
jgi:ABC-2 type transport system ATP-binding protein